jgi:non-ribosomal peptide synthetase component E (peptide arylation enzyme)
LPRTGMGKIDKKALLVELEKEAQP